jgi:DNA-binding beta-propeller fold protein YncE
VSPDGHHAYVTNSYRQDGPDSIFQYYVGPLGKLSPKSQAEVSTAPGPSGIAVRRQGASVYVANSDSNRVSQYDVRPGGKLSPMNTARVGAGARPLGVATNPPALP